nr:MAG: ORF1 [Anelloviridae sp.]UZV41789.1 MAG: ORF1 [Anelloviridae sp.]
MRYRRRYRRPWRRHFFRYRRRRRWPRRHWRRAWRRSRRPSKVLRIKQWQPRRRKLLVVQGWEILGVQGSEIEYEINQDLTEPTIKIRNVAPSNKPVEYLSKMIPQEIRNVCSEEWPDTSKNPQYWDFVGGYGWAKFDLQSLVLRNLLGMNRFSENIRTYTHIRFLKFKLQLVRGPTLDYLFRVQMHRGPYDWETPLIHPAHLLNMPFVTWVESIRRSKCCRMKVIRRHSPTDLSGWYDIEEFRKYELFTYQWTVFDPNNPMGKNPLYGKTLETDKWWNDDWMRNNSSKNKKISDLNKLLDWADRGTYDSNFVSCINSNFIAQHTKSWWEWITGKEDCNSKKGKTTPFLPPIMPSDKINTFWFRYKFYFQLGGASISRDLQQWPIRETSDNAHPCTKDTTCPYCIRQGDLDEDGLLTKEAYERITEPPEHRKKKLVAKLARLIQQRRKRKRVHWWDDGKEETSTSPTHTNPKKFKIECIRRLASRLRF